MIEGSLLCCVFSITIKKVQVYKTLEKLEPQNILWVRCVIGVVPVSLSVSLLDELHGQLSLLKRQAPVPHLLQDHAE